MTDRQFDMFIKEVRAIAEDVRWIAGEGIPSGSFSANRMAEFMKNLDRIATALEDANAMTMGDIPADYDEDHKE